MTTDDSLFQLANTYINAWKSQCFQNCLSKVSCFLVCCWCIMWKKGSNDKGLGREVPEDRPYSTGGLSFQHANNPTQQHPLPSVASARLAKYSTFPKNKKKKGLRPTVSNCLFFPRSPLNWSINSLNRAINYDSVTMSHTQKRHPWRRSSLSVLIPLINRHGDKRLLWNQNSPLFPPPQD